MTAVDLDQLLALEHEGWKSLCERCGGTFYGAAMTNDAVMILVNGMVLDRDTVAASLDDSPPWDSYEILEPRLVDLGENTAALVYRARATRSDSEPFIALMASTYRNVDDELNSRSTNRRPSRTKGYSPGAAIDRCQFAASRLTACESDKEEERRVR